MGFPFAGDGLIACVVSASVFRTRSYPVCARLCQGAAASDSRTSTPVPRIERHPNINRAVIPRARQLAASSRRLSGWGAYQSIVSRALGQMLEAYGVFD